MLVACKLSALSIINLATSLIDAQGPTWKMSASFMQVGFSRVYRENDAFAEYILQSYF